MATTRKQLVVFRGCPVRQNKACRKNGTADPVEALFKECLELLENRIAEMPELGRIKGEQDAAVAELVPIARDSGQMRGKWAIGGIRRAIRQVLHQAAAVTLRRNLDLKIFADRLLGR